MATNIESLVDRAMDVRRRLEERGATEDAAVVEQLVNELTATQPKTERPYYTVSEAAEFIGVSGQTVKNWISRGLMKGYRLGGRIVVPRSELDDYRSMAEASKGIDPLPSREEVVEAIQAGRKRFIWPVEPEETEESKEK
ncbi:MAG TPA: helix-turn-helix domain-containing protein [Ktedonobacterales bacterium]|nr:helix-turn-helix domain-containing protein [Ktedonobacterales bacterium]